MQQLSTPVRRVFGVETEYGIAVPGQQLTADQAARELFQPLVREYRSTNVFAENGGRIYLDVGAHPEYATAECDNVSDLVAQDLAGQAWLRELAETAAAAGCKVHLFKNNVDSAGNGFGCHENYLLHRDDNFRQLADDLIAFLVTRQIIVGAGGVHQGRWCFSERAHYMDDVISAATTRSRPIINTRDEPLAEHDKYRRLHVIVGDSNMCGSTTRLKIASTLAVIDRYRSDGEFGKWHLADPMEAITAVSYDAHAPLQLADGRTTTAVEIQQAFYELAGGLLEPELALLWEQTIAAADSGDTSAINTRIDWAIKRDLVQAQQRRHQLQLDAPLIRRTLLAYHDITSSGLGDRLVAAGRMDHGISQAEVTAARTQPPATTRAHLRGETIALARKYRQDLSADWNHLRLRGPHRQTLLLSDPFATTDPQVSEMWKEIERAGNTALEFGPGPESTGGLPWL